MLLKNRNNALPCDTGHRLFKFSITEEDTTACPLPHRNIIYNKKVHTSEEPFSKEIKREAAQRVKSSQETF